MALKSMKKQHFCLLLSRLEKVTQVRIVAALVMGVASVGHMIVVVVVVVVLSSVDVGDPQYPIHVDDAIFTHII